MGQTVSGRAAARVLREHIREIERAAAHTARWNQKSRLLPREMEWLLDNRYLCRREGMAAYSVIKGSRELPFRTGLACGNGGSSKKAPSVYFLASGFLRKCGGEVTEKAMAAFLRDEAENNSRLSEKELWLFVPMLQAALLEQIASSCRDITAILNAYRKTTGDSPFTAEVRAFEQRRSGKVPDSGTDAFAEAAEGAHKRNADRMGTLITSLRFLSSADLTETLLEAGALETALRSDNIYAQLDEETRSRYRQQLARLARREGISEAEAARKVLELSRGGLTKKDRHVGTYLWDKPLGKKSKIWQGRLYFLLFALLTLLPAAACALWTGRIWAGLLLILPLSAMAKNFVDAAARFAPCRPIPRLELAGGLPEEGKTLCVVSVLLTGGTKGAEYAKKLESYMFANRDAGKNLLFGLLADLPDSTRKNSETDECVLNEAKRAVFGLNQKHGGGFYLFTREREWNARDGVYMAWERKRGALTELCRFLRGMPSGLTAAEGDKYGLGVIKFVITLDGDTALTPGSARQMAGAMLHPSVRPVVDPERKIVKEGHGILAPRMAVDLAAAGKTVFSRTFAGQGGLDPYSGMAGEVYQDLFGQGSFHGKGIFDVDAYLACLDGRFPENRVLSHDLLEGNYLRAGLMEDVELSDGFPATARAWFLRQHRWIRGDWQVAAWIFSKNPTNALSRWKLLDTLRSSLVPVATLAALTAGTLFPGRTFTVILAAALVASASHLLLSFAERIAKPGNGRTKTHAAIITGLPAAACQSLLNMVFLPHHAFISVSAAALAFWRLCFSHKKLLQWTTSAETERIQSGAVQTARDMFPGLAWGVLTACLSHSIAGWILGAAWAASPFIAYAISKTPRPGAGLSDADRAFILRQAALMWQYFEEFLRPEDNFLVPDNYQEQPAAGAAHRTSPTNIGLSLLCALAAIDLSLCPEERALALIDGVLQTVEKMPKWNGHLLNWYDTRTLEPLNPRCVSSVDSGNLCGCLIALREGLLELDDSGAASPLNPGLLASRAGKLADSMLFEPLFDRKKKLFRISVDLDRTDMDSGVYDLLASEARQTSYIAVARGEVEKKHWQRLGRAQTALGRYRGMASWTGTMFEYFMPHLLLPLYRNSLLRESLDFAVAAQRAYALSRGVPWGVSESCFYAFDRALNYQYKAHGVPALAYKRGLGADCVIAPYASFLTLLTHPTASVKNLRRLRSMDMEGIYGFIEAVDFTPARTDKPQPVRCYMSHHLGMSMIAVCNALRDNIMQRRFMRNGAMGAFAGLLQERVPVGTAAVRPSGREIPEKPRRAESAGGSRTIERIDPSSPNVTLLSNGSYTVLCTDCGAARSECGDMLVTRFTTRKGDHLCFGFDGVSLLPQDPEGSSTVFERGRVSWNRKSPVLESSVSVSVPGNENAELRTVTLKNAGNETVSGPLSVYFEPVLQRSADYFAHPAFSKLFIETGIKDGICLVRRRPRAGRHEIWLAFVCGTENIRFSTSREEVLGRTGDIVPAKTLAEREKDGGIRFGGQDSPVGGVSCIPPIEPCVYAEVPVTLAPGEKKTFQFALAVASTPADAAAAAKRTLRHTNPSEMPEETARSLGLTAAEWDEAFEWLARMLFPKNGARIEDAEALSQGREGLWAMGISGDLPLILASAADAAKLESVSRAVRQHRLLALCGFPCDLAVTLREGGDYRRPAKTMLMDTLKSCRAEHTIGKKGGIHLIDIDAITQHQEQLLRVFAAVVPGGEESE